MLAWNEQRKKYKQDPIFMDTNHKLMKWWLEWQGRGKASINLVLLDSLENFVPASVTVLTVLHFIHVSIKYFAKGIYFLTQWIII